MSKSWDKLTIEKRSVLLEQLSSQQLAKRFKKPIDFFDRLGKFYTDIPMQTRAPKQITHSPPKDLVVSARRDLSFFEANFELFDNSIDAWRRNGTKKLLQINVNYDLQSRVGKYIDNAGGIKESDVYKVFIPGETTNQDFRDEVIGSFGMGAKKGIFR